MDYDSLAEGYWQVGDSKFPKKIDALQYASRVGQEISYIYFDHVWDLFDRSKLGNNSLSDLYRQRAQQLRDKYDYLILYFSGGADSYNVLRSFIDNGILLDEVCVKWPMAAIKAKVYTPNKLDTTARNYLSEWDFAIVPVLEWLKENHPKIKITILDWSENLSTKSYSEDLFLNVNNYHDIEIPFMMSYSESERQLIEKGKTVGSIYGIDKPTLAYNNNKWFMAFIDAGVAMGTPSLINPRGSEYFYWGSEFPLIAFEGAYKLAEYLDKHPNLKKYFYSKQSRSWTIDQSLMAFQVQQTISRHVLYDNWTNNFQANKPMIPDRADKQFWIFEHPELTEVRDYFIDFNSLLLSTIENRFLHCLPDEENLYQKKRGIISRNLSKWHFVKFEE
jgi:hypothetical protein